MLSTFVGHWVTRNCKLLASEKRHIFPRILICCLYIKLAHVDKKWGNCWKDFAAYIGRISRRRNGSAWNCVRWRLADRLRFSLVLRTISNRLFTIAHCYETIFNSNAIFVLSCSRPSCFTLNLLLKEIHCSCFTFVLLWLLEDSTTYTKSKLTNYMLWN